MQASRVIFLGLLALVVAPLATGCGAAGASHSASGQVTLGAMQFDFTARYLAPRHSRRDAAYLAGESAPPKGSRFAAVFVEVRNEGNRPQTMPVMAIYDAAGTEHAAFPPNTPYARHFGEVVEPHETQPGSDPPQQRPIKPVLFLFRLTPPTDKPPLMLRIQGGEDEEAEVRLALP